MDGRTFTEIIVSKLGTPPEPFGFQEFAGLVILAGAITAYLLVEYGLGRLIARVFRRVTSSGRRDREPPPEV